MYSQQAKRDINEIIDFYIYEACNERYAKYLENAIRLKISELDLFPERYRKWEYAKKEENIRIMSVEHHSVIFLVDKDDKRVIILRIFHSARNIKKIY